MRKYGSQMVELKSCVIKWTHPWHVLKISMEVISHSLLLHCFQFPRLVYSPGIDWHFLIQVLRLWKGIQNSCFTICFIQKKTLLLIDKSIHNFGKGCVANSKFHIHRYLTSWIWVSSKSWNEMKWCKDSQRYKESLSSWWLTANNLS